MGDFDQAASRLGRQRSQHSEKHSCNYARSDFGNTAFSIHINKLSLSSGRCVRLEKRCVAYFTCLIYALLLGTVYRVPPIPFVGRGLTWCVTRILCSPIVGPASDS